MSLGNVKIIYIDKGCKILGNSTSAVIVVILINIKYFIEHFLVMFELDDCTY